MIRQPQTDDEREKAYDLICQLHAALSYPIIDRDEYERRLVEAIEGGYKQYLYFKEEEVVGLIGFRILNDLLRPRRLFVDDLIIERHYRKQGIGTELLDFAFEIAAKEKCRRVDLEAALTNETGIMAYEHYGMIKSAYLMKKLL